MPTAIPMPTPIPKKGRNENVSTFFHVSSQAVAGRLACLTVVPALVIFSVTPPPE